MSGAGEGGGELRAGPLRVFGYGSLMWRPGFEPARQARARLDGHHRAFCVRTVHHRGTPERPGLVLGLAPGGQCEGMLFEVREGEEAEIRAYLHERELRWYPVYREAEVVVEDLETGEALRALTFLPRPGHEDFLGDLSRAEIVEIISGAHGVSGSNLDYLRQTLAHLEAMGIEEREIAVTAVLAKL